MKRIDFIIITPTGIVHESKPVSITVDTADGQLTILPEHTPIVVPLNAGEIVIRTENNEEIFLAVYGGFLEVLKNSSVNILADGALHAEEIDEDKVREAIERAEKLKEQELDKSSIEYAKVSARLERELAKLRVTRKRRR